MIRKKRILIIDDDSGIHLTTKHILKPFYDCTSAYNGDEAKVILASNSFDIILLDLNMRQVGEGLEYLPQLKALDPEVDIIVVSSNTRRDLVSLAIERGATGYLVKDFSPDQLLITIDSVLARRELLHERDHHIQDRRRSLSKHPLVGKSNAVSQLSQIIEKVKKTNANVLITGETGSGKELVARHIGSSTDAPFVSVDSSTITNSMAESMLFGHEKGAFTGANHQSKGLFEEANGGTIYFDEIGNMPLEIQVKLLRVMQEKEVTRLGSRKVIPLDFRVICATNRDLEAMAASGAFQYDLLQRINVIPVRVPSLHERIEDIEDLACHFINIHRNGVAPTRFSEDAMNAIKSYNWPGNIRELSNVVAYLCTMVSDRDVIEMEDLPQKILNQCREISMKQSPEAGKKLSDAAENFVDAIRVENEVDFYGYMLQLEGKVLTALYKKYSGNITHFSKAIKVSRSHLYSKLNAHGIHK